MNVKRIESTTWLDFYFDCQEFEYLFCRVYFVQLSFGPSVVRVLVIVSTKRGRTQKTVGSARRIKIQKNSSYGAAAGEKFSGCLGGLVAQLRCPDDVVGRVCSYIQDESNNDNDNIDHEKREL